MEQYNIQKRKQELEKLKYGTILSQEITDSDDIQSSANKENEVSSKHAYHNIQEVYNEFHELIGLQEVKQELETFINTITCI